MACPHRIKRSTEKKFKFNRRHYLAATVVAVLAAMTGLIAQSEAGLDRSRAWVTRGETGRPLTRASRGAPDEIAAGYIRSRGGSSDALMGSLRTERTSPGANGVTHVRMEQEVDGLKVHGAYVKAAVNANGELVHLIDRLYEVRSVRPNRIDAPEALSAAMAHLYPVESAMFRVSGIRGNTTSFDGGPFFYGEPAVTAVALPMADGTLARGWLVQTWTAKTNELFHTVVDGVGRVLDVESRTANDSYNVFIEDPGKGDQTEVIGLPAWLSSGSQSTINIVGPNVRAYLDVDASNSPDAGGVGVNDGVFDAIANLTEAPTTDANRAVAVQNLFYLNNIAHDVLESRGFTEAAGNFEGADPVNAEAQDGSGINNANFSTPPDGSSPRMQMYLWSGVGPDAFVTVGGTDYGAFAAGFGGAMTEGGVTGPLEIMAPINGCTTAAAGSLTGSIALIERGSCDFTVKVLNAQKAGAVGAVITNNVASNPFGPGGSNKRIKITAAMVSQSDGNLLRTLEGSSATLRKNPITPIQIDSALDSDVVYHEYGHGLTWRMIGNMSGPLAGAIGEGASDVNAFLINGDDRIGEYSSSDPLGIRRFPYDGYPNTYADVVGDVVHNDGEIYAAAMWKVLQNYIGANLTAADLHGDFVDGMNYTPSAPTFEEMRDGMLESVAGTGRECLIWRGFAASGIGVGASGTVKGKRVIVVESFTVPPGCQ